MQKVCLTYHFIILFVYQFYFLLIKFGKNGFFFTRNSVYCDNSMNVEFFDMATPVKVFCKKDGGIVIMLFVCEFANDL